MVGLLSVSGLMFLAAVRSGLPAQNSHFAQLASDSSRMQESIGPLPLLRSVVMCC